MKNFIQLSLLIFILNAFNSCSDKDGSSETVKIQNYVTVIEDSIMIDRLSTVEMLDYHDESKQLLILDEQLGEVFILNGKGEKVSSFEPYVDGPNFVETSNFGWIFLNANELMVYGQVYFHRLSTQGKRIERIEYPVEVRGWAMLDYNPLMIESFQLPDAQSTILTMIPGALRMSMRSLAAQDTASIMYLMNLETQEFENILSKPEKSIYRNGSDFYGPGRPLFTKLKDDQIAFTYHADTAVYIYDMESKVLLESLAIPKAFRPEVVPVSFNSKDQTKNTFINSRVMSTGSQVIVEQLGQIPEEVYAEIRQLEMWWESSELEAAVKKYMTRKRSLYSKNQFLGELEWTVGEGFQNIVSTNSDFFWVQRVYPDERDYRTFLKVKIVPEH